MKNFDGYLKQKLGNDYVLLAGGSHKALSEFSMAHSHPYIPYGTSHTNDQINTTSTGGPMLYDCRGNSVVNIGQGSYYAVLDIGTYPGYHPQLAMNYQNDKNPELYIRKQGCVDTPNSTWSPWYKVLTTLNSSISGKTVTINGVSQTYAYDSSLINYVLKTGDTMTGTLTINTNTTYPLKLIGSNDYTVIHFRNQSDEHLIDLGYQGSSNMAYFVNVKKYGLFTIDNTGCYYSTTASNFKQNIIWHSGNDGSGSGLDADLLDGYHASNFALSGHNHDDRYIRFSSSSSATDINNTSTDKPFLYDDRGGNTINKNGSYYSILDIGRYPGYHPQLAMNYQNDTDPNLYIRKQGSSADGTSKWSPWYTILHDGNYANYVKNASLTLQTAGTTQVTFYANDSTNKTFNVTYANIGAQPAGNYVPYETTSSRASVDSTNSYPKFYNLQGNNLISGYLNHFYVINMGHYSGSGYSTQIAMNYDGGSTDSELFIRREQNTTWQPWRRVLHDNNYGSYAVPLTGGKMTGTLIVQTDGTGNYNQGIRVNRNSTSSWCLIMIGTPPNSTDGTGSSQTGWLVGTPASSNSLIFCPNNSSESIGLCLKGSGNNDMKWNNNTVYHAGNLPAYPTKASWNYDDRYLRLSGGSMTGGINLNRSASSATGLGWYSSSYNSWCTYMSPPGSYSAGYNGGIKTVPSGTYVTSWALRNVIENGSGFGFTWEYMAATGTAPTIIAELRSSDGTFKTSGNHYAPNYYTTSDARKKQNIHKISDNIKQFEWKESGETSYGFVAQDLEVKHPELVNDDGNMKTVNYNAALSLVVAKLENRVKELEAKLGLETPPPVFNQG